MPSNESSPSSPSLRSGGPPPGGHKKTLIPWGKVAPAEPVTEEGNGSHQLRLPLLAQEDIDEEPYKGDSDLEGCEVLRELGRDVVYGVEYE